MSAKREAGKIAGAISVSLGLMACARAADPKKPEKEQGDPVLPASRLAGAARGDWSVARYRQGVGGFGLENATLIHTVKKHVGGDVSFNLDVRNARGEAKSSPETHDFDAIREKPSLSSYLSLVLAVGKAKVAEATIADDKLTVGGKELTCKRVAFKGKLVFDTGAKEEADLAGTLWVSSEVKATGLVGLYAAALHEKMKVEFLFEVAGWGHDDHVDWGKREGFKDEDWAQAFVGIAKAVVALQEAGKPPAIVLAENPLRHLKDGDWMALDSRSEGAEKRTDGRKRALSYRTTRVTDDEVTIECELVSTGDKSGTHAHAFSKRAQLKVEELIGHLVFWQEVKLTDVTVTEAQLASPRDPSAKVACYEIGYREKAHNVVGKLWLSREPSCPGIVREHQVTDVKGSFDFETWNDLAGAGGKDGLAWGKTAQELVKVEKKK